MTIAVLAVQGAFLEHRRMFDSLGIASFEIRKAEDVNRHFDGLVLPGGESTVQGKLLRELHLLEPLRKKIADGMPVLGTCAGLILLAEHIELQPDSHFATLPVTVSRNAYGRQLGSFCAESSFADQGTIPMTFIRAPYVKEAKQGVSVLAEVDGRIVAVRWKNQLGVSFHPELTEDTAVHRYFAAMIG
ncbi:MAG: pyridoxal 5'-phosphate synthase glutaminase subunit PdxT [Treponema sp.]|nr:pyridoxal 5'-phosphate synthase glutaminase subunit PdxT [Treponema sp.]